MRPCEAVAIGHAIKLQLCDRLECLADTLPRHIDRQSCLQLGSTLLPALRAAQSYEEERLFPLFVINEASSRTVSRLKTEHIEDEAAAEELTVLLMYVGRGGSIENAEAFGFSLRSLFGGLRRHIAFERDHVVPQFCYGHGAEQGRSRQSPDRRARR